MVVLIKSDHFSAPNGLIVIISESILKFFMCLQPWAQVSVRMWSSSDFFSSIQVFFAVQLCVTAAVETALGSITARQKDQWQTILL